MPFAPLSPALAAASAEARRALLRASASSASSTVRAVVFDLAGTVVDYGSCAPLAAFQDVFASRGVPISAAVARGPMGTNKRDHISAILYDPAVAARWAAQHGRAPGEADVDAIYAAFTPIQVAAARARAQPVPGAVEAVAALRARGVRVGGNSGYNAEIVAAVVDEAASKHGFRLDAIECAGPANGRPKPWMSTRVLEQLDAFPLAACVKVDDTLPGIVEGLNAGMWTVGVARSGNELGLPLAEADELERSAPADYAARMAAARARLAGAGAHFVIDSVAEIVEVVDAVERLLAEGRTPLA
jgi:phosphonoacetaldehyde hydrolase